MAWIETRICYECWKKWEILVTQNSAEVISFLRNAVELIFVNYHGISLLNAGNKLYTKIFNNRVIVITEPLLSEEQCGFRVQSCKNNVFAF